MNIIRDLRLDRGWPQEELATASGISVRTIQRLENGGRASLKTLKCLAAVFESELSELRENMQMNTAADNVTPGTRLSEEDRAALSFASQLRRYAELEGGRDPREEKIRHQVRSERAFFIHAAFFMVANALLLGINLIDRSAEDLGHAAKFNQGKRNLAASSYSCGTAGIVQVCHRG